MPYTVLTPFDAFENVRGLSDELCVHMTGETHALKRITVGELRAALTSKPSGRRCFYCKTIQHGAVCECCGAREK